MLRKSMIALCAMASVAALTPNMALARSGGGGGGGGHGGGGFGGGGGRAGGFSGGGFAAHAGGFSGGNFAARGPGGGSFGNSFARAPASNVNVGAVPGNRFAGPGNRFASGNFGHGRFGHGFRHGRRFFVGGFVGPYYDYWDYPDYAYDDSYYDNGNCYVVQRRVHTPSGWRIRPVQVCG